MFSTISKSVVLAALAIAATLAMPPAAFSAAVIAGDYYEENAGVGCGVSNGCALFFTAVPAGKILLITRLSCLITEAQNRIVFVTLGQRNTTGGVARRQYFPVSLTGQTTGLRRFAVNGEADMLIGSNVQPGVQLVTDVVEASSFECQIIGRLNPTL